MAVLQETGRATLGVCIAMLALATIAIIFRFLAKMKKEPRLFAADYLIIAGYGTFVAYNGVFLKGKSL